jgi:transcriptional regulator with XRE-family HTH domain
MGFRENLKLQLQYSGMLVKDLAARSGVKKSTIDSYLRERGYTPSVEAAVSIARTLGVTAECLVLGEEEHIMDTATILRDQEAKATTEDELLKIAERLNHRDFEMVYSLATLLRDHEKSMWSRGREKN